MAPLKRESKTPATVLESHDLSMYTMYLWLQVT